MCTERHVAGVTRMLTSLHAHDGECTVLTEEGSRLAQVRRRLS